MIHNKRIKAYSLFEIIVSLAIVAIIMVMLTNVLLIALSVAKKSYARSFVREEQNNILTRLEKDIRNARYVETCGGKDALASCQVYVQDVYTWTTCPRETGDEFYVCKKDSQGNILEGMSEDIIVNSFSIEEGLSQSSGKKSIIVMLVVSHRDPEFEINNQVRQLIISTRNYGI